MIPGEALLFGRTPIESATVTRLLGFIGAVVSALIAIAIPFLYLFFALGAERQSLALETKFAADEIGNIVQSRPETWEYEVLRLLEIASRRKGGGAPEDRVVRNSSGDAVVETDFKAPRPFIVATAPFFDSGKPTGMVEARRSIRPILLGTGLMAVLGLVLGLGGYIVYQNFPMRFLKNALASLEQEKEKSETTLVSIREGVVVIDSQGRIVLMNRMAEEWTGWRSEEGLGKPVGDVLVLRTKGERQAKADPVRAVLVARNGGERTIEGTWSPIRDREGGESGHVIVFRDETEKLRLEDEILRARQLESLGILAGGIAHDFNNFLTGILGNVSLARHYAEGNAQVQESLLESEKAAMRARELAQKLMTFSKGGEPSRKVADPLEIVAEASRFAVSGTGVKCVQEARTSLWNVLVDPAQISQVVNNIVINAVQAMEGSGIVRISLENAEMAEGQVRYVKAGKYVVVRIKDDGPGIPAVIAARIFDPYFTTKTEGKGLGLATSYNIMKSHGGNIFVESPPGHGAIFTLYIPATLQEIPNGIVPEAGDAGSPRKSSGRILAMDDEGFIRDLLRETLSHLGYTVTVCGEGMEAVARYMEAAERKQGFDAVIMDLTVPGGMGGKDAAREILAFDSAARLIVSSGYSHDPVMAHPSEFGFMGVVGKPYRIEELEKTIRAVLECPPSRKS